MVCQLFSPLILFGQSHCHNANTSSISRPEVESCMKKFSVNIKESFVFPSLFSCIPCSISVIWDNLLQSIWQYSFFILFYWADSTRLKFVWTIFKEISKRRNNVSESFFNFVVDKIYSLLYGFIYFQRLFYYTFILFLSSFWTFQKNKVLQSGYSCFQPAGKDSK